MTFEKLPAVKGSVACLTCGAGARSDLDMHRYIAVGFGASGYSKDGNTLWQENGDDADEYEDCPTVADVEKLAKETTTEHDWRIFFYAPLYEAEYQRQGDGVWILVKEGKGFA